MPLRVNLYESFSTNQPLLSKSPRRYITGIPSESVVAPEAVVDIDMIDKVENKKLIPALRNFLILIIINEVKPIGLYCKINKKLANFAV